jgi:hypothetical protein
LLVQQAGHAIGQHHEAEEKGERPIEAGGGAGRHDESFFEVKKIEGSAVNAKILLS